MFADEASESSIIVEILGYEDSISDDAAADYYFGDMAETNQVVIVERDVTIMIPTCIASSSFLTNRIHT